MLTNMLMIYVVNLNIWYKDECQNPHYCGKILANKFDEDQSRRDWVTIASSYCTLSVVGLSTLHFTCKPGKEIQ